MACAMLAIFLDQHVAQHMVTEPLLVPLQGVVPWQELVPSYRCWHLFPQILYHQCQNGHPNHTWSPENRFA